MLRIRIDMMMSKDFKIGDRVIFNNSGKDEKGVIHPLQFHSLQRTEFNDIELVFFIWVLFGDSKSKLCHKTSLQLDVQYYRELRLNKLLDK